ncbi:hypothetical protein LAZ67_3002480 [Cordylochernes scorpioides]|uniref:DUF4817 domain-containing protein n=1 Tax=Cordylochernes scorpioides TaxID=51811 RepID=A0ABY6K7U0_9ARAC|nr:hypothetical protein LAZ67_3002480 [Cordylochernes scorpioides]
MGGYAGQYPLGQQWNDHLLLRPQYGDQASHPRGEKNKASRLSIPMTITCGSQVSHLHYHENESVTGALRAFRTFKGIRSGKGPVSCYYLRRMIRNFEKTGSLEANPRSGRPSTCESVAVTVSKNVEAIETLSKDGELSKNYRLLLIKKYIYSMDTSTLSNSDSKNEVVGGTSDISSDKNTEIYSYHDSESELESENEEFGSSSTSSFYVGRDQTTRWKTSE